jgi:sulfite reductase alpha subunit-like flavoprotein
VSYAHRQGHAAVLCDLAGFDPDELAVETDVCVFILSTFEGGSAPANAKWFVSWLDDTALYVCSGVFACQVKTLANGLGLADRDFRITKEYLDSVRFAVLALGDSLYGDKFATVGKTVHRQLQHIGFVISCF